jgi:hypothetical protein
MRSIEPRVRQLERQASLSDCAEDRVNFIIIEMTDEEGNRHEGERWSRETGWVRASGCFTIALGNPDLAGRARDGWR